MIGDPRPTTERAMISKEQVKHNFECLKKQVEGIFGFEVVNNNDWYKDINVIDFLKILTSNFIVTLLSSIILLIFVPILNINKK